MKDFLKLKKDHFNVDEEGFATVIDKVESKQRDMKVKKRIANSAKTTCEVI
jgi:hypothetical protein